MPFNEQIIGIGRQVPEALSASGRPMNLKVSRLRGFAETEDKVPLVAGLIPVAGQELARQHRISGCERDNRADRVAVRFDASEGN